MRENPQTVTMAHFTRMCKQKSLPSHWIKGAARLRGHRLIEAFSLAARLFFEQKETLASLPFLIWELTCSGIQKVVVVRYRLGLLMQGIVRSRPEEVSRRDFGEVF